MTERLLAATVTPLWCTATAGAACWVAIYSPLLLWQAARARGTGGDPIPGSA